MYKPLLVNVSVSPIVSGVQLHMTSPHREKTENEIFWKILVFCPQNRNMPWKSNINILFTQSVHAVQQNQSELGLMPMEYLKVALN